MKRIVALLIIIFTSVTIAYFMQRPPDEKLPVINPFDLEVEMVDSTLLSVANGHKIGAFSFVNQDGKVITDKTVKGKVFVAEYFFTTCGTICPKMNLQMQRVQKVYKGNKDVKILSFTVDPETDTVEQMKQYAIGHGADANQWHFLTGEKTALYKLARTSFFILKPAESQNLGDAGSDFIHTNNFVLVDKEMRIRGYYNGTSTSEVDKLIKDISSLLKEK